MKLDVYSDLRQSTAYASLLDDINRQFLTHADESVLKEASAALLHAKSFEELGEVTGEKLAQLQEETVAVLMACVRGRDVATQKLGDGVVTELINTVRRLEYLASITDVREMLESVPTATITSKRKGKQAAAGSANSLPVEVLLALLNRGTSVDELEEELIVRVLKVLLFYFMWKVKAVSEEDPKDITDEDVDALQERRQEMVLAVARIITSRSAGEGNTDGMDAVRIAAAGTLLDVYTLFATLQHRVEIPEPRGANGESAAGEDDTHADGAGEALTRLVNSSRQMTEGPQTAVLRVFSKAEKKFAKAAGKPLEERGEGEETSDSESEAGPERRESAENEEQEDEATLLTYEQRLCEFTGKIVLAVLGDVVDRERFLKRVCRNEKRLGKNFGEVVGHLIAVGEEGEEGHHHVAAGKRGKRGPRAQQHKGDDEEEIIEDRIVVSSKGDAEEEEDEDEVEGEGEGEDGAEEEEAGEGEEEHDYDHDHDEEGEGEGEGEQHAENDGEEEEEEDDGVGEEKMESLEVHEDGDEDEDEEMADA